VVELYCEVTVGYNPRRGWGRGVNRERRGRRLGRRLGWWLCRGDSQWLRRGLGRRLGQRFDKPCAVELFRRRLVDFIVILHIKYTKRRLDDSTAHG
jgi:hypothetical protein